MSRLIPGLLAAASAVVALALPASAHKHLVVRSPVAVHHGYYGHRHVALRSPVHVSRYHRHAAVVVSRHHHY